MNKTPLFLAAALVASAGAHAQQGWLEIDDDDTVIEALGMSVDDIDDANVYDAQDSYVGEAGDVYVNLEDDSVAVSLDVGGFLGIGDRDVLVPLEDFTRIDKGLMVDLTEEQLEALPEHDD